MNSELISVIVPVYNCEKYLSECVESILSQSYKNFEILLLNDGSKDGSEEICLNFSEHDMRIKVISHMNMGVSKTRKKGLNMAKGKYITFIDSDDAIQPDYLQCLYNKIVEDDSDVVCCNSIDSGEKNVSITESEIVTDNKIWLRAFFERKRYAYCIWGKLYKKEILKNINFPEMKYAEDTLVVLNVFKKAKRISLLNYFGYFYRDNLSGAMRKSKGLKQPKDVLNLAKSVYDYCMNSYIEFEVLASKYLINSIFNAIISGSCSKEIEWKPVSIFIEGCLDSVKKKYYFTNIKGVVVFFYSKFPRIIYRILRIYKKIKGRVYLKVE